MEHYGIVAAGSTLRIFYTTHDKDGGAIAPSSAFEAADVRIYKDGSATQRSSEAGYTMISPFDSVTGLHLLSVDLSDNTDSGFYAAGSRYTVVLVPNDETIDSEVPLRVLADFSIGPPAVNVTQIEGSDPTDQIRDSVVDDATRIDASALNTATGTSIPAILVDMGTTLDGLIQDLPTNSEFAAALAAADDAILAAIAALANLSAAEVNAEVLDVLNVDTFAEPTGVPPATDTIVGKLGRLHMALRNKVEVTATKKTFYDDGDAAEWEQDLSDDGTTYTQSEANAI